ncbi:glycosyltransferase family 9 protein [filamentous cyanobacterium LEGE 11480]|uniref:Glycosyltransferase family 9 protein n=1 Tax=Romeriopsis navalis LEGE 11480 TaxID=2777977 RepID=A0A928VKF9_9CYAN|nr:glycosyltransferase family 9 protein [Romeriopsis navalis]MBE9029292.1 glycosyltransferase family 9 protein [Romeriopsis navalis LEGE 11480]
MRILAFVPGGIADQLLFFPTLSALNAIYPGSKIDVVAESRSLAAYQVSQVVSEKIPFDLTARNSLSDWGNLLGIVRDREYEIVLAPRPTLSLSLLLWLSGIPTRISYADVPGANLFTTIVPTPVTGTYIAAANQQLLDTLPSSETLPEIKVNLPETALDWSDAERKRLDLSNGGYVVMYSMAAGYPTNSWETILQDFQKKQPDLPIVLLQDAQNAALVAALTDRIPALKTSQPMGLGQIIALLAGASLVLTVEGEVLQSAIAAQTFTLGLFGASDPATRMPTSDRCVGIKSSTNKLADIAPATVLERVWNGG